MQTAQIILLLKGVVMALFIGVGYFLARGAVLGRRVVRERSDQALTTRHSEASHGVFCMLGSAIGLLLMLQLSGVRMGNTWLLPIHLAFVLAFVLAFLAIRAGGFNGRAASARKRTLHRPLAYATVASFSVMLATGGVMLWT